MNLTFLSDSVIFITIIMLIVMAVSFWIEKERRPAYQSFKIIFVYVLIFLSLLTFKINLLWLGIPTLIFETLLLLIFIVPFPFPEINMANASKKYDERMTIFSRMFELKKGNAKYLKFYKLHPELEEVDNELRSRPGLLSPKALFYDKDYFSRAQNYIDELQHYIPLIDGAVPEEEKKHNHLVNIETEITKESKRLGASSCGFTHLKPSHFYSTKGRGDRYGQLIENKHKYAIAIAVEMEHSAVMKAPHAPVIEESTLQYLIAAKVATGIAVFLRSHGYEAKAHIDANYEVICPTVARDAGLGTIGRMGILMTPDLGPRVRLAVVTTNLPLQQSKIINEKSIQYFCSICKKCAASCPSKAIRFENFQSTDAIRYKINHEKCYGYWAKVGTDCARCMSVCPYSHPNNILHKLVRFGIRNNPLFAHIAYRADNYFYGRIPKIRVVKLFNLCCNNSN